MAPPLDLAHALQVACRAASAAAEAALRHFHPGIKVEFKGEKSPVTVADREAEQAILSIIRAEFPQHGLLCEESGCHGAGAESRWIIDPIDGTRGFIRGGLFWGPLVALEHEGDIVVGAMTIPTLGESYWAARGMGCYRNGEKLQVSACSEWSQATLSMGELDRLLVQPWDQGVLRLVRTAQSTRCYGDLGGVAMVLAGRADAWIEAGVQAWDLAPHKILVEEAGGRFTDFTGLPTVASGNAVATNGVLHAHVLEEL
ncbi:MAG: inositol phosphatase [Deltaproteobacteria bacterium]|nr:inositol phosphatase [Deltaproteobacteria bacterium]